MGEHARVSSSGISGNDWPDFRRELEETLTNAPSWAGIQVDPG